MLFTPKFVFEDIQEINPAILFEKITNIDRKTYKSWENNERKPRKSTTNEACEQFNVKIKNEFGINIGLKPEMLDDIEPAPPWKFYFNHPVNINLYKHLPNTKKLILFFEKDGLKFNSYLKKYEFEKAVECYASLDLERLKFENDIFDSCKKAKSLDEFLILSLIFWFRILMYSMASLDAEILNNNEEESRENKSRYHYLLPVLENGEVHTPIGLWFNNLKKETGYESWDKIIKNTRLYTDMPKLDSRQFRRWANGEIPKTSTVGKIIMSLFPEDNPYWHITFYRRAKTFNFIYYVLNEMINKHHIYTGKNEDIIEFFQDYYGYYEYFLEKYTAPVP